MQANAQADDWWAKGRPRTASPDPDQRRTLRLRLVGKMAASNGTQDVILPKVRKTRAVLAILALSGGKPVLRDQITALLWSTREREQARASLRQAIHELLETLADGWGGLVQSERHHLRLDPAALWVDVHQIARATPTRPDPLDLLDGGLLEDLHGLDPAFDAYLALELARLQNTAAGVAAAIMALQTAPCGMIAAARRLLDFAPAHEGAWRTLMQAHGLQGERAQAVEAYEACAAALAATAQTFPSAETTALLAQVRSAGLHETAASLHPPSSAQSPVIAPVEMLATVRRGVWVGVAAFHAIDAGDADWLSAGLAEEITTALARFRWINLIAPGSIAALASEPNREGARWQRLNLAFLLDGTIRRAGPQIRVTVRLLDMRAGGKVVWSRRFDRQVADLFELQDEIASQTVAQIDPELLLLESRRAASRPIGDATAHELMLRAIPAIYRLDEAEYAAAGEMLAQAAAHAPDSGTVFAWWACWHAFLIGQGWAPDPQAAIRRAGELAERAVTLDPSCARALSIAAYVRSFVQHQSIAETLGLHERALALNPNLPFAWAVSGLALSYAGRHDIAIARAEHAKRLSPFDPHSFFFDSVLMVPHLALHNYETVVALGRDTTALNPAMSSSYKSLLSALGHLGRTEEAARVRERLLVLEPHFTVTAAHARTPLCETADLENYLSGLRLAGLAEG